MKQKYRFFRNFSFALSGLKTAWGETAFRLEFIVFCAALVAVWWLPASGFERAILLASLGTVLAFECLNTAVEKAVDLCTSKHHPLAGAAKDCASAAVMCAICCAAGLWIFVASRWFA